MASVRFKSLQAEHFVQTQALVQAQAQIQVNNTSDVPTVVQGDTWILQSATVGQQPTPQVVFWFGTGASPGQIGIDISSGSAAQIAANIVTAINNAALPGYSVTMASLWSAPGYVSGDTFTLRAGAMILGANGDNSQAPSLVGKITNLGNGATLLGGIDSIFTRPAYFNKPTYGLRMEAGTFLPAQPITAANLTLLPDNLVVNGAQCSDVSWHANGWVTHLPPAAHPPNRFDFGTVAGTSYAETVPYLGDIKGWLVGNFSRNNALNPSNFDVDVHFVAFKDVQAGTTYQFTTHVFFAVAYLGNQDARIDGQTLVTAANMSIQSTTYGPNAGANVAVTPPADLVWDVPGFNSFLSASDIFQNFPNAPSSGQDIGLTGWPFLGNRALPTNGSIVLSGGGANGLANPYVRNATGTDAILITAALNPGNDFLMSIVMAYSVTGADQVLFDANYTGTTGVRIWIPANTQNLIFAWGSSQVSISLATSVAYICTFFRTNNSIEMCVVPLSLPGTMQTAAAALDEAGVCPHLTLLNSNDLTKGATAVALYGVSLRISGFPRQLVAFSANQPPPAAAWGVVAAMSNFWLNYYVAGTASPYVGGIAASPDILA